MNVLNNFTGQLGADQQHVARHVTVLFRSRDDVILLYIFFFS